MEAEVRGVLNQFSAIERHALELQGKDYPSSERVKGLVEDYIDARIQFDKIKMKWNLEIGLRLIDSLNINSRRRVILQSIDIQCKKAIGVLESITIPMPKEDIDRLSSIREELKELSIKLPNIYFEKNIEESIKEYEQRHFLASALISGRVIIYALDKIPGKSIEEKIEILLKKGIIQKNRKDLQETVMKADKKARNFFSHDITVTPLSSDAISLLGDTLTIVKYALEFK